MTEKLRTAVIGVGHLGREHARVYAALEEVDLVAVCDINETTGQETAARHGVKFTRDFRDLFGAVDAVSVATPTIAHHEVAGACLNAGIQTSASDFVMGDGWRGDAHGIHRTEKIAEVAREFHAVPCGGLLSSGFVDVADSH